MNDVSKRITPAAIHKTLEVKAPVERAFRVFTTQMGKWWNKDFSINGGVAQSDVVVEPRAGGRWYEIGEDGSQCPCGRVLEWDEPKRLVLAWQIDSNWRYDPELETTVEVRFDERDGGTLVTFEHRGLEAFGEEAESQRERMDGGWGMLLERYRSSAAEA